MKTPQQVKELLKKKLLKNWKEWILSDVLQKEFIPIRIVIRISQNEALTDFGSFERNERAWKNYGEIFEPSQLELTLKDIQWGARGGNHSKCDAVTFKTTDSVLSFVGDDELLNRWEITKDRLTGLSENKSESFLARLLNEKEVVEAKDDFQFNRLVQTVNYLEKNRCLNCFIREAPIPGIDTKWLNENLKTVCDLLSIDLGEVIRKEDFLERWKIKVPPTLVPIRNPGAFLSELSFLDHCSLPLSSLVNPPKRLIIIENLQTGLALTQIPSDTAIILGLGFGVKKLASLSWISSVPIIYFGDLDKHGLRILSMVRGFAPQTQSILTNIETFKKFERFAIDDPTTTIFESEPQYLTPEEHQLYALLTGEGKRLEQERIPLAFIEGEIQKRIKI